MITTFVYDCELNRPSGDDEVDELLNEVRQITGRNYQVIATSIIQRRGFLRLRRKVVTRMSVYLEVGGIGPWQWLTCTRDDSTVKAYLLGILNGHAHAKREVV